MRWLRWLIYGLLGGTTLVAGAATVSRLGVASAAEPQGISLRDASARPGRGMFFAGYRARSHRGGGAHFGK